MCVCVCVCVFVCVCANACVHVPVCVNGLRRPICAFMQYESELMAVL